MARGRKNRGLSEQYKHISIYVSKSDWDRLNYLADGCNKTVSKYIMDNVLTSEMKEYNPTEKRVVKPLCITTDILDEIKARAEKINMSVSNYILAFVL